MRIVALFLVFVATLFGAEEKLLYIYNWSEYMPEKVLKNFTKETGIKIKYSTFDSNEAMYAKLKSGGSGKYDIVVPSTYFVSKMAKEGMLEKIDTSKLKNFNNIDPKLLHQPFDPKNEYSIPYLWGTTAITYNKQKLGTNAVTSWQDFWNPKYKNSVLLNDDLREVFGVALKTLGYSINSTNKDEIEKAYLKLKELLPNVKMFYSESQKSVYLANEALLGMNFNGENYMANLEKPGMLEYVYPKEGAIVWVDSLVIPKGAKHIENAHLFIDYILRPDVAKIIIEEIGYATPNIKAKELLPKKVQEDRIIYPADEDLKNSEFLVDVGNEALKIYEQYWERLKTGK